MGCCVQYLLPQIDFKRRLGHGTPNRKLVLGQAVHPARYKCPANKIPLYPRSNQGYKIEQNKKREMRTSEEMNKEHTAKNGL